MKNKIFFVILAVIMLLGIFHSDALAKKWTIMVYLASDNNLEEAGLDDYIEMAKVGSTTDFDIVVQMDRIPGESSDYGDWTTTKRFHVTQGSTPTAANQISDLGEKNMGDPQTAKDFINWAITNYPSDHYALIFWDHGDGWTRARSLFSKAKGDDYTKGTCSDDTDGDCLYFTQGEFEDIFSYAYTQNSNQKLDIVGFDVCLDGMWENMVASEPYFEYFVASEMNEWNDGWSYWYFLQKLSDNTGNLTAKQLADFIVEAYENGDDGNNNSNPSKTGYTLSSIALSQLSNLNDKINVLAQELACAKAAGYTTEIATARSATFECNGSSQIDLYDLCVKLKAQAGLPTSVHDAATDVQTAINLAVSSNFRVILYPNNHGIAIYYPESGYNTAYNNTHANVTGTYWDNYLKGEGCPQPVIISYSGKTIDDSAGNGDGTVNPGENINMTITLLNSGTSTAANVTATISTSDTYVNVTSNSSAYPDIGSGNKEDSSSDYVFSVGATCPEPHKINFLMNVTADSYTNSFTFQVTVGEVPILLVIDDEGIGRETYYRDALDNSGYLNLYDEYVVSTNGPSLSTMEEYDLIIWFTGWDWDSTLTSTDESNLTTYLTNGGALLLSAQDYLYHKFGATGTPTGFAKDYIHVDAYGNDDAITRNYGIGCDPITDGMDLVMEYGGFNNYSDTLTVGAGATQMFKTLGNDPTALHYPDDYASDSYHVIFLPFPFSTVPNNADPNNRATLMGGMVEWLLGDYVFPNTPPGAFNLQSPADGATDLSQPIALNWSNSIDPDEPCDSVKYRLFYSTDPTFVPQTTVANITQSQYSLSGLESETTYYWKVRATDEHSGSTDSTTTRSFTTAANQPPAAFTLLAPVDGAALEEVPIKF
ncbi:hypothetical protein KAU33_04990, partial [Candidatus Dependentiae bacterium]|nr:hypothetical protein [Candidatus Dependentiae bacterium]